MTETSRMRRFFALNPRDSANGAETKAMVHAGGGGGGQIVLFNDTGLPMKRNYAAEVGDGLNSSVLAGPLNFLMRTFLEAPPIVERRKAEGQWEVDDDHDLTKLMRDPNPFYSGEEMWMAAMLDYAFGNAYLYKVRNTFGGVVELWWIPRHLIEPRWLPGRNSFIDFYEYRPGAGRYELPPRDVVHLRFGMDPRNNRLGLSPLGALMRDVAVDDTAADFAAAVHRNLGVIGIIISPKEKTGSVTPEALAATKAYLQNNFTGEKRGNALALGSATEVQLLQYNMQQFDISPIRDVSEERVCAAMGIPASVVGFGTGLQQTKVGATMKEMRQLAWTGGIIPQQRIIAAIVMRSLLYEFEGGRRQPARFRFDDSKVRALWEDNNEKHERVREDYRANLIDRATALREVGRPAKPDDEGVYFSDTQPKPAAPVKPGTADPDAVPPAIAARNGAGKGTEKGDDE